MRLSASNAASNAQRGSSGSALGDGFNGASAAAFAAHPDAPGNAEHSGSGDDSTDFQIRPGTAVERTMKIVFDRMAAGLMLIAALPVFAILWFLVKKDGGPGLYGHVRVGRGGVPFPCLKFRTMVVDSDTVLARVLEENPTAAIEWKATRKLTNDPRITPVGHFLRRTSIDELPQLLNVLRGEMSLVGPRPVVEAELAYYGTDACYYRAVRPGITGLWQISGRSDTTYGERVALDARYVRTWSFFGDMVILLKTLPAVLMQKGAR